MTSTAEKILLLLYAGTVFSYEYIPGKKWRILKNISHRWQKINQQELEMGIRNLYKLDIINKVEIDKNLFGVKLTEKGRLKALNYQLLNIKNKHQHWDGKWRMVAFDIPEKYRKGRDALRQKLKKIGFRELQESIFITPYDCKKEILLLVDFFKLEKYVRFGILEFIDNESHFKKAFKLARQTSAQIYTAV